MSLFLYLHPHSDHGRNYTINKTTVYMCESKVNKSFSNIAPTVVACRNPCSECIHTYSWVLLTHGDQSWLVSSNKRQDVSWVYLQALGRSNHYGSKIVRGKNWWKLCTFVLVMTSVFYSCENGVVGQLMESRFRWHAISVDPTSVRWRWGVTERKIFN
jgi:hypothetical protein